MAVMTAGMTRLLVPLLAGVLALGGCSSAENDGGDAGPTGSDSTTTGSPSPSPSLDEQYGVPAPAGVTLTTPGSELGVGDSATIAWAPKTTLVGALEITVSRLRTGRIADFSGFKIDAKVKASTPYYVNATVTNVGDTDLGGLDVPLYLVDQTDTLYEQNHFGAAFKPCAAKALPKGFTAGKTASVCLVYLAASHGILTAVSFRPSQEFDPITWTGTVLPAPTPTAKPSKKATRKS